MLIADLTAAFQPCSYADVMRVDGILQEAAGRIPSGQLSFEY